MKRLKNIKILIIIGVSLAAIAGIALYWISNAPKRALEKQIISMTGMNVDLTFENAEAYFNGIDSAYKILAMRKLIVYVDSSYCSGCFISQLSNYHEINDTLSAQNAELVIVMHPKQSKVEDIRNGINTDCLPFWCIIDKEDEFNKNNHWLSDNHLLHSFLLDENDKIILVGNPISNPRVKELFNKTLKKNSL